MTEIEEVKAQIKVLEKKLSFLEELEKTKSPVEEAFKDWMGVYPPTNPSVDNIFDIRWRAFQMGYNAAYEEKVAQEPEDPLDWLKPQTPEQTEQGLKEAFREAVKQGVVSSTTKPKTLTDIVYDWWCDIFTSHSDWDMETSIENLVDRIELFLPKEHETNSYKWNECIRMIREKLR